MGSNKDDSIACPNQMRAYGVHVDERPSSLFPTSENTQCIIVDDIKMQLHMKGPLIYLPIRRPSLQEVHNTELRSATLSSPHGWDPYGVDSLSNNCNSCSVSSFLSCIFRSIMNLNVRKRDTIEPEHLMSFWGIGKEMGRRLKEKGGKRKLNLCWENRI